MKFTNILLTCGAVISAAALAVSCVKETGKEVATESADYSNKAFVQVFDLTLSSTRNYVYVDGAPVTGAALAYGATFPATPANFAITAGFRAFLIKDTLATSTQPPMSFAENFQANSNYTIFTYDTVNAAKQKTVTNAIVIPDDTTSRIRFANFAYSSLAITPVDVFSKRRNAVIFSNVATTDVTNFIPFDSRNPDTLQIRPTGTTTNLLNNNGTVAAPNFQPLQIIITPVRKRSYTVIFRGSFRTDLTSAAAARVLSFFSNN